MNFHVITLFPKIIEGYLSDSIVARAIREKKISVKFYNPRDFVKTSKSQKGKKNPYLRVDQKPYGGGPGMVIEAEPVIKAVESALKKVKKANKEKGSVKIIHLSPSGKKFSNSYAQTLEKKYSDLIIICGRYEGIDARVKKIFKGDEISVGDFVLTGGEIPAMIFIDSISRQVEGVLGNVDSCEESREASSDVYTRPEVLTYKGKKYKVPTVLLSGHHKKIEEWRKSN